MIEGVIVFVVVASAVYFVVRSFFSGSKEDGTCHSCEVKKPKP